jgi:hypothetical protein
MATSYKNLPTPSQPRLPGAGPEYDPEQQNSFNAVLRLFFNQIINVFTALLSSAGMKYLRAPYGAFASYTTQSTTANTATLLTLSNTDFANEVSIASSKITVDNAGIYNLQFSVQVQNLDTAPQDTFIWLKQNGTDITGSTGKVGLPARKGPSDPFHDIKGWNYFLSMNASDYVEIYWSTTSANVTIPTYAASGSPTKPSTASVVATISFVSAPQIAAIV